MYYTISISKFNNHAIVDLSDFLVHPIENRYLSLTTVANVSGPVWHDKTAQFNANLIHKTPHKSSWTQQGILGQKHGQHPSPYGNMKNDIHICTQTDHKGTRKTMWTTLFRNMLKHYSSKQPGRPSQTQEFLCGAQQDDTCWKNTICPSYQGYYWRY